MTVRERVLQAVREAVRRGQEDGAWPAGPVPELHVEVPKNPRFGDFSCNLALLWGGAPREVAEALRERLPADPAFREVRVEGPGFLNFFLSAEGLREILLQEPLGEARGAHPPDPPPPRADPDLALRVQLAHARAAGLLRMGRDQGMEPVAAGVEDPSEREMVRTLEALPWTARKAALRREPQLVLAYALDLAERFHSYYEGRPLLSGAPAAVQGRLALARGVQRALAACCEIMGVDAPERM